MTIRLEGRRRHGKSQMALVLGILFSVKCQAPLYSNDLQTVSTGIAKMPTMKLLMNSAGTVFILDEFWRQMDSRLWKYNTGLTQWWQLQGHSDIILIYTTQKGGQMDIRVRETDDLIIYCEKRKLMNDFQFKYTFIDGYSSEIIKIVKTTASKMKEFYKYYDYVGKVKELV
jgi:hypothetical protein